MRHIVPAPTSALVELSERVAHYQASAQSANTRSAYARAWGAFEAWCRDHDVPALPASPAAVAAWITERADDGAAVATLAQALSAIADKHASERLPSPVRDPDLLRVWTVPLDSLGLLRAAVDTADCVLNLEYADLGAALIRPNVERYPEILVAAVLSQRFRELRQLLDMYVAATRRHRADEHDETSHSDSRTRARAHRVVRVLNTCLRP